jgi:hypothetical protein
MRIPKSNLSSPPLGRHVGALTMTSTVASAAFVLLLALMHLLEPEFDPTWRFISEYQLGAWGPLMSAAFLCLGVSATCLVVALASQVRSVGGWIGIALLGVSAAGFLLAATFRTDSLISPTMSAAGLVHSIAAVLGGFAPLAVLLIAWSLARNTAWRSVRPALWWTVLPGILSTFASLWQQSVLATGGGAFGPGVEVGGPNRLLMLTIAAALFTLATLIQVAMRGHKVASPVLGNRGDRAKPIPSRVKATE